MCWPSLGKPAGCSLRTRLPFAPPVGEGGCPADRRQAGSWFLVKPPILHDPHLALDSVLDKESRTIPATQEIVEPGWYAIKMWVIESRSSRGRAGRSCPDHRRSPGPPMSFQRDRSQGWWYEIRRSGFLPRLQRNQSPVCKVQRTMSWRRDSGAKPVRDPRCGREAWAVLDGKLWHATSMDELRGIRRDRYINPGKRFKDTFVSARGWVSLFDFGPSARVEPKCWNKWAQWFGFTHDADLSVWLEVDRKAGKNKIVEAEEIRVLWNAELDRRTKESLDEPWAGLIIPGVEGCYRGCLPIALVERAVIMRADYSVVADLGGLETIEEQTIDMLLET